MKLSAREILSWLKPKRVIHYDKLPSSFSKLSTDSRTIRRGQLFLALKGERFDGHDFVVEAFKAGALAAVVEDGKLEEILGKLSNLQVPLIVVDDTLKALGNLARGYREEKLRGTTVLALTGSVGKTSVKEWITLIAEQVFGEDKVVSNLKSFNNEIGVPLTILNTSPQTELLILELGARREGDIEYLCQVAQPNYGLITSIGPVHLQFFKTLKGVAKVKGELLRFIEDSPVGSNSYIPNSLRKFYQIDLYRKLKIVVPRLKVRTKVSTCATYITLTERSNLCSRVRISLKLDSKLLPRHQLSNFNLALSVVEELIGYRLPLYTCAELIRRYTPPDMRTQLLQVRDNILIINDAYNSNPISLKSAIGLLEELRADSKLAIIGDMLELGSKERFYHSKIAVPLSKLESVWLYGRAVMTTYKTLKELASTSSDIRFFKLDEFEKLRREFREWIRSRSSEGVHIGLLKASRGLRLERLLDDLT